MTLDDLQKHGVRVKPLEWEPDEAWGKCTRERAPAFGGEYQIVMLDPGEGELPSLYFEIGLGAFLFRFEQAPDPIFPDMTGPRRFASVDLAKAAGQADYEKRICAALEPIAPPDVAQAARVIENNGAEATAVAMLFHIEISLRTHGKATLTTGDDFGQQVLEFCAALRALLPEGGE